MKYFSFALLTLFLSAQTTLAQNTSDDPNKLESTVVGEYEVSVKQKNASGDVEKMSGKIFFDNGMVLSTFSEAIKFPASTYTVKAVEGADGAVIFTSESRKKDGTILYWRGRIENQKISGEAKRDDNGTAYFFEGKLI